jgi:hypothetical protein
MKKVSGSLHRAAAGALAALLALPLQLFSAGIGGTGAREEGIGGSGLQPGGGIGGTGILAVIASIHENAGGGIGGTGKAAQPLVRRKTDEPVLLASLGIAGLEVALTSATQWPEVSGVGAVPSWVREGLVVAVHAVEANGITAARAVTPYYPAAGRAEPQGPDTWRVDGRTVEVHPDTPGASALAPGAEVRVSGLPRPDGVIVATRVDPSTPGEIVPAAERSPDVLFGGRVATVIVEGYPELQPDGSAALAGLTIAVDAGLRDENAPLSASRRVRVTAHMTGDGMIRAQRIESLDVAPMRMPADMLLNSDDRNADPSDRNDDRSERSDRSERVERAEREDRAERAERAERTERSDRPERAERADRVERSERTERTERTERSERSERAERTERSERSDRSGRD